MSRNVQFVDASPAEVFGVLADPRGYAYWVLGSKEIRDADPNWPQPGSRFHHTMKVGPLQIRDHSVVEDARPDRFLQLKVKARPLGTARVKLDLEATDSGTRVTMTEDPADPVSRLFTTPLSHLLVRARNEPSLERLAELAEGRVTMPGDEPAAPEHVPQGPGSVENPLSRRRASRALDAAAAVGRGAVAGFAGAMVMSVSTNAEMRLRDRPPSDAPAKAIARIFGIKARGKRRKMQLALAGHLVTSISIGAAAGGLRAAGVRPAPASAAAFGMALLPEVVIVPALGATDPPWRWSGTDWVVTVVHHGVYAAATGAAFALLERRGDT